MGIGYQRWGQPFFDFSYIFLSRWDRSWLKKETQSGLLVCIIEEFYTCYCAVLDEKYDLFRFPEVYEPIKDLLGWFAKDFNDATCRSPNIQAMVDGPLGRRDDDIYDLCLYGRAKCSNKDFQPF
jgi:hypothetical protein